MKWIVEFRLGGVSIVKMDFGWIYCTGCEGVRKVVCDEAGDICLDSKGGFLLVK